MGEIQMIDMDILGGIEKGVLPKEEQQGECTFLVPFFNFFYYFLLVPFKITFNEESNQYQLKSRLINKILCTVAHILVFLIFIYTIIIAVVFFVRNHEPAIVLAFSLTSDLSALVAYIIIINLLWRRQNDFLRIIQLTRIHPDIKIHKGRVTVGFLIYSTLFFLFACISIINWIEINDINYLNNILVSSSKDKIGNGSSTENQSSTFSGTSIKYSGRGRYGGENKILNGIILCLVLYTSTFYLTIQGILLTLALSLRQFGRQFTLEIEKIKNIDKGITCYRDLQLICEEIRRVYGDHLMAYYITSVSYYAEAPHILMGRRGDTERVVLIYFVVSGVVWILAAEFHHQVWKKMQKWIRVQTNGNMLTVENRLKLLAISNEISSDPVSLSSKYFRVTYSTIGTMVGLILTYGIIVCQLYHDVDDSLSSSRQP